MAPGPTIRRAYHLLAAFLAAAAVVFAGTSLRAEDFLVIEENSVAVLFDPSLKVPAEEVAGMYPGVRAELEHALGWGLNLRPTVILIRDRHMFEGMAESPITVAFAIPKKSLIVIDQSRMNTHPFTLRNTLKHELCHLMLHDRVRNVPRWLDEGISQWVSDGLGDIVMDQKRSLLNRAALRGGIMPIRSLSNRFPGTRDGLVLAYEESKSFVAHMVSVYGKDGLLDIIERMKRGEDAETAVSSALSTPFDAIEGKWRDSLRKRVTWFTFLSYHLYDILFGLMALISIAGFIRVWLKKRSYRDGEDEDSSFPD
jgi:hypothetical protein